MANCRISTSNGARSYLHSGKTSADPSFTLPEVVRGGTPDGMLQLCKQVAQGEHPDVWIHAAAVLDYYTEAEEGKKGSGAENWSLDLSPGPKHISELAPLVSGSTRIGFKLETGVSSDMVIARARGQIERYGVDAVIANIMEEMNDPAQIRARVVHSNGDVDEAIDDRELCEAINSLISDN